MSKCSKWWDSEFLIFFRHQYFSRIYGFYHKDSSSIETLQEFTILTIKSLNFLYFKISTMLFTLRSIFGSSLCKDFYSFFQSLNFAEIKISVVPNCDTNMSYGGILIYQIFKLQLCSKWDVSKVGFFKCQDFNSARILIQECFKNQILTVRFYQFFAFWFFSTFKLLKFSSIWIRSWDVSEVTTFQISGFK